MRRMYSENQLNNRIAGIYTEIVGNAIEDLGEGGALLPAFPETLEDKTYVLKLVNGVLSWVEEE